jgi:hypothetical protein
MNSQSPNHGLQETLYAWVFARRERAEYSALAALAMRQRGAPEPGRYAAAARGESSRLLPFTCSY